MRGCLQWVD
ncbi:rCG30625, partial [Rattus norvegicus]